MLDKMMTHFEGLDLDLRKSGDGRFMDQKVTPDVLSIVADCVVNYVDSQGNHEIEFTAKNIWSFEYSNQNVKSIFNKPDVLNESAKGEYNKFFQQPLKTLSYARVLSCEKRGNTNFFSVMEHSLLRYISIKEKNSLEFIVSYLEKVLKDSDLWPLFADFFVHNNKDKFRILKSGFEDYIIQYTAIAKRTEPRRIFTKIINPLAYHQKIRGTRGGSLSPDIIGYDELMYNRKNWRDTVKKRGETREEHEARAKAEAENTKIAYIKYTVQKAKSIVKKYHYPNSEVKDQYAADVATTVHHIFKESDFPQIASYLENLILLTENQHRTHAHPLANFSIVDKDYQLLCLLAKSDSIEESFDREDTPYSKEDFCFVLSEGWFQYIIKIESIGLIFLSRCAIIRVQKKSIKTKITLNINRRKERAIFARLFHHPGLLGWLFFK